MNDDAERRRATYAAEDRLRVEWHIAVVTMCAFFSVAKVGDE